MQSIWYPIKYLGFVFKRGDKKQILALAYMHILKFYIKSAGSKKQVKQVTCQRDRIEVNWAVTGNKREIYSLQFKMFDVCTM